MQQYHSVVQNACIPQQLLIPGCTVLSAGNSAFVDLNGKTDTKLVIGLAALALGGVFWLCFWPFTWNKQGKRLGSSLILKHSKRVTGVMKSNICARSDNPCQPLPPAQAEALRT